MKAETLLTAYRAKLAEEALADKLKITHFVSEYKSYDLTAANDVLAKLASSQGKHGYVRRSASSVSYEEDIVEVVIKNKVEVVFI